MTGASGFIGRELITALRARGIGVVGLRRKTTRMDRGLESDGLAWRIGDVAERETLRGVCAGVDTVFHLAGHAHVAHESLASAEHRHQRTTLQGTINLLDEAGAAGIHRFIFASSVKAMGESTERRADETTEPCPSTPYGRAKLAAEQSVLEMGRRSAMHTCVLRLPMVYGSRQRGNLAAMIAGIDRGWFPPLPEVGNRRSLVHVRDAVEAFILAADAPLAAGKVYLVTDGVSYSTRIMYDMIRTALGRAPVRWAIPGVLLRFVASVGNVADRWIGLPFASSRVTKLLDSAWYCSDKIERELGYRPHYDLSSALSEIVADYRDFRRRRVRSF